MKKKLYVMEKILVQRLCGLCAGLVRFGLCAWVVRLGCALGLCVFIFWFEGILVCISPVKVL